MLFIATVTRWLGVGRGDHVIDKQNGTQYIFDINNVSNLKEEGTGCQFNYLVSTNNRRTGYDEIHCTSPYITVRNEFDVLPISNTLELSYFPNNDVTKTPIIAYIDIHDFCYAWSHNPYPQYSWLVYSVKGLKDKRILVDMPLTTILALDSTSDENDIQWYYYVDLQEIIVLTKKIRVEYDSVVIGTQTWMAKNWDDTYPGSLAYDNDESNALLYGRLYTWAMINAVDFAPTGWRIPTKTDLDLLETFISSDGGSLKETGFTYWDAPNTGASNSTGFGARGSGFAVDSGGLIFHGLGLIFAGWTSTLFDPTLAYTLWLTNTSGGFTPSIAGNNFYYSVRFIKI